VGVDGGDASRATTGDRPIPLSIAWVTAGLGAGAAAAGILSGEIREPGVATDEPLLAIVALLAALTVAARLQVRFSYRDHFEALDLFEAVLAPIVFVLPGPTAVAMAAAAMAVSESLLGTSAVKRWFNVAQWAAATGTGSLVFAALSDSGGMSARNVAALAAAMGTMAAVNHIALMCVFALSSPGPFRQVIDGMAPAIRLLAVNGVANFAFGVLLVAAIQAGAWVTPLFLVPLGMLHWANRGYAESRADRARLRGLQQATHALVGPLDPRDAVGDFLAEVRRHFAVEVVEVVLPEGDGYRVVRLSRDEAVDARSWTCPADADTLALALLRGGVPARVGASQGDGPLRDLLRSEGWRDCLAAPLPSKGLVDGVLCTYNRTGLQGFEAGELAVLEALARELAAALEKADLVQEVLHQALHDGLTGLPNRTLFNQRVQRAIAAAEPVAGQVAVLLIDVNRFKEVNDTLGHHNGDLLLQDFSTRLQHTLRPGDTVARLGGDEFGIVVPRVVDADGAVGVAERVLRAIGDPFPLHDMTLDVDAAIGIAVFPEHGEDPLTLLQRADVAMYAAKSSHAGYEVYTPENDRYSPRRLALVGELRSAASHGELHLHYQPKCDLRTARITGVEALVRWEHPRYGPVAPDEFIPVAEQTGSIAALTRFVLEEALAQCSTWGRAGVDLGMAVNVSARSLLDTDLPDEIDALLRSAGVAAHRLTLEVTESSVMADPVRTTSVLDRLHDLGVHLSIDDFGTGYSSLSYLQRLPVDEIKIDRSFVQRMAADRSDDVIVRSTIDLGHNLGLRVVAEGVEDRESCDRLSSLGCDAAQGYWLSRPVPAAEITGLVARREEAGSLFPAAG
jgi:diguanylate cyclase (GGDEF)-like protein